MSDRDNINCGYGHLSLLLLFLNLTATAVRKTVFHLLKGYTLHFFELLAQIKK